MPKWISIKDSLPGVSKNNDFDKEQGFSDRVLVYEDGEFRFGKYHHKLKEWRVEGRGGLNKVTHWQQLVIPINY